MDTPTEHQGVELSLAEYIAMNMYPMIAARKAHHRPSDCAERALKYGDAFVEALEKRSGAPSDEQDA